MSSAEKPEKQSSERASSTGGTAKSPAKTTSAKSTGAKSSAAKSSTAKTSAAKTSSAASTSAKSTSAASKGNGPGVRRVAIIGGNRIPFARSNGPYANASNQDMLTAALDGLVSRFGLQGETIGEVAAGAVLKHARDFNLARESVLGSKLSADTPASDVQMACGTGLQAIVNVANKIALGQLDSAIAGGVDTTSDAPLAVNDDLRKLLVRVNAAKSAGERLRLLSKIRPGHIVPEIPRNAEPRTGLSMGEHASLTAKEWDVSRADQDELTAASHQHLAAAYDRGFFDDLVTPFLKLTRDQNLRPDSSAEKLGKLKPVFGGAEGTMTAGNSTPLSDGASTVLLATEEWAAERNLPVLAYLTFSQTAAVDYVHGGEGLLMAPAYAVPRMLAKSGLSLQDFDFYEIHEAFASQVLATLKAWESPDFAKEKLGLDNPPGSIDRAKLNVNGSSLAAGHPFAATGGRIVGTLAKLLNEKGSGRGLISICAAGGQGITAILEK
jgi:acetyl-CoA C-acetyltransferase